MGALAPEKISSRSVFGSYPVQSRALKNRLKIFFRSLNRSTSFQTLNEKKICLRIFHYRSLISN